MKTVFIRYFFILIILLPLTYIISCSGRPGKNDETVTSPVPSDANPVSARVIKIVSPKENEKLRLNAPVRILLDVPEGEKRPDSVHVYFDGRLVKTLKSAPWEYSVSGASNSKTGRRSVKLAAFLGGRSQSPVARFVTVYSDVTPKRYRYKVIHTYPHDSEAFTQGLIYDKGNLFESTGQSRSSSLREVELNTGKVIRQHNLDGSLFGEGIALYGNRIYQVTWENQVGFIYDKATFNIINKIYYSSQGWGLTTVDDRIVMSDGTNVLSYYEPEMFTVVSRIEVYDDKKEVESLNELEYINGEIWANIWMSDLIARIDPGSGKVLAYIDLKGLLSASDKTSETDVLNGIAYDPDGKRIFVTGKKWPRLFEISLTE